ncbi:prepilin peptidase [Roseovarius sp. EL26]|uniref:prepilin peptidase n=1 Tax=Roseovarius sp. EL26 TaxID=2126672 RepID=UPI000EA14837|nr:prepilin peptidase [Roseovarius sp. EL26]
MYITSAQALWFLPFVTPICLWVTWSDLSAMRIPNKAVLALFAVFVVVGLFALPTWSAYGWRFVSFAIVLALGIVANAAGLMGAGDSKFLAAAAPFVVPADTPILCIIFSANLLACFCAHRVGKNTRLRALAPDWTSWSRGKKFPMGFALSSTLVIYLILGLVNGT